MIVAGRVIDRLARLLPIKQSGPGETVFLPRWVCAALKGTV